MRLPHYCFCWSDYGDFATLVEPAVVDSQLKGWGGWSGSRASDLLPEPHEGGKARAPSPRVGVGSSSCRSADDDICIYFYMYVYVGR